MFVYSSTVTEQFAPGLMVLCPLSVFTTSNASGCVLHSEAAILHLKQMALSLGISALEVNGPFNIAAKM